MNGTKIWKNAWNCMLCPEENDIQAAFRLRWHSSISTFATFKVVSLPLRLGIRHSLVANGSLVNALFCALPSVAYGCASNFLDQKSFPLILAELGPFGQQKTEWSYWMKSASSARL